MRRRQLRRTGPIWHRYDRRGRHLESQSGSAIPGRAFLRLVPSDSAIGGKSNGNPVYLAARRQYLCPAAQYGSSLLQIPAPGTEDDDHNPPRIAPRNLFDLSVGEDNLFHGDKYKWSLRFTVINLANKYALYNFLSTFSGTHYVTPRTLTAEIGFHF